MAIQGRPRQVSDAMIVAAGERIGLTDLTVAGAAADLGVSEMTIYRRTGGIAGLRRLVADGIIAGQHSFEPTDPDPETALVALAVQLRDFVLGHPGIAAHLADLGPEFPQTLHVVDESQRAFASRFGWTAPTASILVSVVAEHAVALAQLNPTSHRRARTPGRLPAEAETIRAGAEAAAGLAPARRFEWSMRAVVRGAMQMLGLETPSTTHETKDQP